MSRLRFSVREAILAILVVGVALGWWCDHVSLNRERVSFRLSAESYEKRLEAIPDSVDELGDRPATRLLIYALSDPYPPVASAADQSLRRISGKRNGFGEIDTSTPDERLEIMASWIEWYLTSK